MKTKRWMGILVVIALAVALFFIPEDEEADIVRIVIPADEEFVQEDFSENEEEGLVNRFVEPDVLYEDEDIRIRLIRLIPKDGFEATVEVAVETNIEEKLSLYVASQVDEAEKNEAYATVHEEPAYQRAVIEEVYKDGIKIEENKIANTELYETFYFRNREYLTESVDYNYKEVYDFDIVYEEGKMEAEFLQISMQLLYASKIETAVRVVKRVGLFSNDVIEVRKKNPVIYDEVTTFADLNQEIIEVGSEQYELEHNKLYLRNIESEEEILIYAPEKRGHYILEYYVGESCIYFLEEIPGEEIDYPDPYKKYARLLVMNRDGTEVSAVLDNIECDWFYIPSLYVYDDVLYMYDWDFLNAYRMDAYGKVEGVVFEEESIYANI